MLPTELPATCAPTDEPGDDATVFPPDATAIPPVELAPVTGELGGADNQADATKRTATFTVTVPAGSHVGSVIGCLGNGSVEVATMPDSKAYQEITCNASGTEVSELVAEDDVVLTAPTTYTVTVKATAESRWDVSLFACAKPAGECQA